MVVFFKMISSLVICVFQICPVQSLHHLKSHEVLPSEKVASMSFVIQKAGKVREWNGIPHIINTTIDFLSWSRSRAGERSHKHDSCLFHNDVFFSIVRISSLVSYYSTTDNIIQLIVDFRHILLAHDDDDLSLVLCSVVRLRVCMLNQYRLVCINIITMGDQLHEFYSFSGSLTYLYLYRDFFLASKV